MGGRERLHRIADLAHSVVDAEGVQAVLDAVAEEAVALCPRASSVIRLVDRAAGGFRLAAAAGPAPESRPEILPFGHGPTETVLDRGEPITVTDVGGEYQAAGLVEWPPSSLPITYFGIPIVAGTERLGVLAVAQPDAPPVPPDIAGLEGLAGHAAVAIRTRRLIGAQQFGQRALDALLEVAHLHAQAGDPEAVGREIVESVLALISVKSARLYRLDPATGDLPLVAVAPFGTAVPHRIPRGEAAAGIVVNTREPFYTPNVLTDSRIVLNAGARRRIEQSHRSVLAVPLLVQETVLGALALTDDENRRYEADEIRLVQAFADQAALALHSAEALATATRRRRAAEELARVARLLTESLDISEVGQRIVAAVLPLLGVRSASLRLLRPDGSLISVASAGAHVRYVPPGHVHPPGVGLAGLAVQTGRTATTADLFADPRITLTHDIRKAVRASGDAARVAAPLRTKGQIIGVLGLGDAAGRIFSPEEIALAEAFGDQAALALENARLLADAQGRRREAEVIAALARSLNASLDADTVLQRIVDGARELIGSDLAHIRLWDPATQAMVFRGHASGYPAEPLLPSIRHPGGWGSGPVLMAGRVFRSDDVLSDPRVPADRREHARQLGLIATMVVPIMIDAELTGALVVGNRGPRPFTDRDEAVLLRLADHAAIAMRNSRLFAREQAARAEAEASESRYRSLFSGVPVGLFRSTPAGQILDANTAMVRMLGYPDRDTLLAVPADALWAAIPDRQRWMAELESKGEVIGFECVMRRRDGADIWARLSTRAVRDASGRVSHYEGAVEDVTRRKQAEEAQAALEEQLRQAQKMEAIGQLTGGVAHDFNNLLTVIIASMELAAERQPALRSLVDPALQAGARGADLTRQLLAFARRQPLQPRAVDIGSLVEAMSELLRRTLGETISLETVRGGGLWTAEADPGQLESAVLNLAINARDAMPGGGQLTIETANVHLDDQYVLSNPEAAPGQYVMIAVTDTGVGMTPEVLQRAVEPFFTTKGLGRGTGLGLSMVYGFVKQSGGHFKIYSEVGQGTTVRIYLPRARRAATVAEAPHGARPVMGGHETILVVEDDASVREVAVAMLLALGYQVLPAADGREALAILEYSETIDLLFTDVVLPGGISGPELVRLARQQRPRLKVLYTSGYTTNAIVHQGRLDEGVHLLNKPYRKAEIASKIRRALDSDPSP